MIWVATLLLLLGFVIIGFATDDLIRGLRGQSCKTHRQSHGPASTKQVNRKAWCTKMTDERAPTEELTAEQATRDCPVCGKSPGEVCFNIPCPMPAMEARSIIEQQAAELTQLRHDLLTRDGECHLQAARISKLDQLAHRAEGDYWCDHAKKLQARIDAALAVYNEPYVYSDIRPSLDAFDAHKVHKMAKVLRGEQESTEGTKNVDTGG